MKHSEPSPRPSKQGPQGARVVGGEDNVSGPGPEVMAADTLEGDRVINAEGEDLGAIHDIMIDVQRGCVAYAVLSRGGILGLGDKLYAIPWNAMTLDADRKCFVLDAAKERFDEAPGFDKDHWPSMADSQWASQVHEFYGVRPYWSTISREI